MKKAFLQAVNSFRQSLPMMIGLLMLINFLEPFFRKYYSRIFSGNYFIDPLIGAAAGSISFGIPVTSYVVGGELLNQGVSLVAVAAFILAWTTVGVAMLPLESSFLGKKFAVTRNVVNFIFSLVIAVLTVVTLKFFQ